MPIVFEEVSYCYHPGTPFARKALYDINLSVNEGEILGIVGPTGSGKSTLLQLMNGLLLPDQGRVLVDGQDTRGLKGRQLTRLRQTVGLVFQFAEDQVFENTVFDDVAFGPRNLGLKGKQLEQRVRQAMEALGLDYESFAGRSPRTLSGGEKRRVAIAGVLAMEPPYLVLDEPTAGLDAEGRRELISLMSGLRQRQERTLVFVSHRLQEIIAVCDRIAVLVEGRLAALDTPRELLKKSALLENAGLEIPEVNRIMRELSRCIPGLDETVLGAAEAAEQIVRVIR